MKRNDSLGFKKGFLLSAKETKRKGKLSFDREKELSRQRVKSSDALLGVEKIDGQAGKTAFLLDVRRENSVSNDQQSTTAFALGSQSESRKDHDQDQEEAGDNNQEEPLLTQVKSSKLITTSDKNTTNYPEDEPRVESPRIGSSKSSSSNPILGDSFRELQLNNNYSRLNHILAETLRKLRSTTKTKSASILRKFEANLQTGNEAFIWGILLDSVVTEARHGSVELQLIVFFAFKHFSSLLTFVVKSESSSSPTTSSASPSSRKLCLAALMVLDHVCYLMDECHLLDLLPQLVESAMPNILHNVLESNTKRTVLSQQASDTFCNLCHTFASLILKHESQEQCNSISFQHKLRPLVGAFIKCHETWLAGDAQNNSFNQGIKFNLINPQEYRTHFRLALVSDWKNVLESLNDEQTGRHEASAVDFLKVVVGDQNYQKISNNMGSLRSTFLSSHFKKPDDVIDCLNSMVDTEHRRQSEVWSVNRIRLREVVSWLVQKPAKYPKALRNSCRGDFVGLVLHILKKTPIESPTASLLFCLL